MKCYECDKSMSDLEHNYGTEDAPCCIACYGLVEEDVEIEVEENRRAQ